MQRIDIRAVDVALDRTIEAALDPALWSDILDNFVAATNSFGANLIPTSDITRQSVICTDSVAAGISQYFADGWHKKDWRYRGVPRIKKYGTARDQEYTSLDEFRHHAFYRLHAKYGIGKSCIIGIEAPGEMLALTLHRRLDDDFYSDEEAAIFTSVRGRFAASAAISNAMSKNRTKGMLEAFESTGIGAIFFDRHCRVTDVTSAARQILGPDLDIAERELRSRTPGVAKAIKHRMRATLNEDWIMPTEFAGTIVIPRNVGRPLSLQIQRLGGRFPDLLAHSVGVCLIDGIDHKPPFSAQQLRERFGLTSAESEIALKLSQGHTLRNIAEEREISYETVRTHMRSILCKTDTNRQTELVALLGRLRFVG